LEYPGAGPLAGTSSSSSSAATMFPLGGVASALRPSPLSDSVLVDEPVNVGATEPLASPVALSVSSSSSTEDSDSEDEVESDDSEDEEDDELVDEDEEEARKTALSAGVEKVSKHKD